MKMLLVGIMSILFPIAAIASPSHYPSGLAVSSLGEVVDYATDGAVGDDDMFIYGKLQVYETLKVNGGLSVKSDPYLNLVAKSSNSISGTAGITITTNTVNNAVGYVMTPGGDLTQIAHEARSIYFTFGGASNISSASVTTSGLDARGNVISETQVVFAGVPSTTGNYAFSYIYGSTLTFTTGAQDAAPILFIGTGDKIGLLGDVDATTDVFAAKVQTSTTWADETSDVTVDVTYDTWVHSDVPDAADDYEIFYRTSGL